jgi:hypothetical protein
MQRVHRYDAPCPSSILHTRDDAQAAAVTPCSSSFFVQEIEIKTPIPNILCSAIYCHLGDSGVKGPSSRLPKYGFFFFFFLAAVSVSQSQQLHYSFGCCDTLGWCIFSL